MWYLLLLFIISFLANTLSALAGGGAGLLQLPALLWLQLPFATALTTHKIASVFLGLGACWPHWRSGLVGWRFALLMVAFGLPGVVLGARTIVNVPEQLAVLGLGLLTLALGIYSFFKKQLGQQEIIKHRNMPGYLIGGLGLFVIGFLNGSLTSGTGLFVTLWTIFWFGFDYKKAVAYTLILVGLFWNGTGALSLAVTEPIAISWLPVLILGSLLGGYCGARLAHLKGNQLIKRTFEWVTIAVGISMLVKAFAG